MINQRFCVYTSSCLLLRPSFTLQASVTSKNHKITSSMPSILYPSKPLNYFYSTWDCKQDCLYLYWIMNHYSWNSFESFSFVLFVSFVIFYGTSCVHICRRLKQNFGISSIYTCNTIIYHTNITFMKNHRLLCVTFPIQ